MIFEKNVVLITGGSSGIGLELARILLNKGHKVLICGRSEEKLHEARQSLPDVHTLPCDLSKHPDRIRLFEWVLKEHPACNVLINNAALVHKTDFRTDQAMIEKTELEIQTNLLAPIALSKLFLPLLEKNKHSAIINITTGLVYAPRALYPIYNATKAGLHSFTKVLRHQLSMHPTRIIEVMMPVVNTPWHSGKPPKIAIHPLVAVNEMVRRIENGEEEIRVGKVKLLYMLSRLAPALAFRMINQVK